jgi:hypothetical protein
LSLSAALALAAPASNTNVMAAVVRYFMETAPFERAPRSDL